MRGFAIGLGRHQHANSGDMQGLELGLGGVSRRDSFTRFGGHDLGRGDAMWHRDTKGRPKLRHVVR